MLPLDKDMKNIKIVLPCSSVVEQETVNFKVVGPTPTEAAKIANASKGLHHFRYKYLLQFLLQHMRV